MCSQYPRLYFLVSCAVYMMILGRVGVAGDIVVSSVNQLTFTSGVLEAPPYLGNDSGRNYAVFTRRQAIPELLNGEAIVQELDPDGAPTAPPIIISEESQNIDRQVNDAFGPLVLFTDYESVSSAAGVVKVFNQVTGNVLNLSGDLAIISGGASIDGSVVAWTQGRSGHRRIYYFDMQWIGTGMVPKVVAGSDEFQAQNVEIGDRFIVFDEIGFPNTKRIGVIDRNDPALNDPDPNIVPERLHLSETPGIDQSNAATDGDWVAYELHLIGGTHQIISENLATGELHQVTDPAVDARNPSVSKGLIAFESNVSGSYDIFIYRISDGVTFQLTNDSREQAVTNLLGELVAFAEVNEGLTDIFVARIQELADEEPANSPPVADAGPDQTAHPGDTVTLDGSNSFDPDGDSLSYFWRVEDEVGEVIVSNPNEAITSVTLPSDRLGVFKATLTVTDAPGELDRDTAIVNPFNSPPVADAGPPSISVTLVGEPVHLNGCTSFDPDGDPLVAFNWAVASQPVGSVAVIEQPDPDFPEDDCRSRFVPDVFGDYEILLTVVDAFDAVSPPDSVLVSFENLAPVADAGPSQSAVVGDTVTLNGTGTDPNGDEIVGYSWTFVSWPGADTGQNPPALIRRDLATASFVPLGAGTYVLTLIVSDGFLVSTPSNTTVEVITVENAATNTLQEASETIGDLPETNPNGEPVLVNPNMSNALTNKINAVLADIEAGNYQEALNKLRRDILRKTDGCATSTNAPPEPDRNDWIRTCDEQAVVYWFLIDTIGYLETLVPELLDSRQLTSY